jgi:hypothetical protein
MTFVPTSCIKCHHFGVRTLTKVKSDFEIFSYECLSDTCKYKFFGCDYSCQFVKKQKSAQKRFFNTLYPRLTKMKQHMSLYHQDETTTLHSNMVFEENSSDSVTSIERSVQGPVVDFEADYNGGDDDTSVVLDMIDADNKTHQQITEFQEPITTSAEYEYQNNGMKNFITWAKDENKHIAARRLICMAVYQKSYIVQWRPTTGDCRYLYGTIYGYCSFGHKHSSC